MKTTIKNTVDHLGLIVGCLICLVFLSTYSPTADASIKKPSVSCQTNFGEKAFTIEDDSVAFHNTKSQSRSISSLVAARTHNTFTGVRKTLYRNGNKHLIHIENFNKLSENDDYLTVTTQKGHKMTYPLNCKLK